MLEFRDLVRIEAVVAHGGFTRAARALGMTQPALTRSIAAAEAVLHGQLFRRGRTGAEPTALCRLVLAEAPDILARMQALQARLDQLRGGSGEEIALVAGPFPFETACLPAAIAFRQLHPRVRLRLDVLPWPAALAQLRARLADLAVITAEGVPEPVDLDVEPLPPQRLAFAVRAGHPLLSLPAPSLAQALRHPLVTTAHLAPRLHRELAQARDNDWLRRGADIPFPALLLESVAGWAEVLRGTDGVALVTLAPVAAALARGELALLPIAAPWLTTRHTIVRLRDRPATAGLLALCAALREANARAAAMGETLWAARAGAS